MSATSVLTVAVRWLTILSMAALIGALALDLFVLPAGAPELLRARDRLRRWCRSCIVALTCATLAELSLRTATMSGGGVASAFAALPTVLTRTHFGALWLARLGALVVALVASSLRAGSGTVIMMLAAVAVALTSSLTGHAADWGDLSLSVLVDWIHVVAASAWTGGLIGLAFVVAAPRSAWPSSVVDAVARRFSAMAGVCLLVVVASGIYGGWAVAPRQGPRRARHRQPRRGEPLSRPAAPRHRGGAGPTLHADRPRGRAGHRGLRPHCLPHRIAPRASRLSHPLRRGRTSPSRSHDAALALSEGGDHRHFDEVPMLGGDMRCEGRMAPPVWSVARLTGRDERAYSDGVDRR